MDALLFLKHCHRKLNRLFKRSDHTQTFDRKKRIFKKIKTALAAHSRIEQGILYPALEEKQEIQTLLLEFYKKHKHVEVLVRGIDELVSENKPCDYELKILEEMVSNWNDEEEKKIFPRVRELLDEESLKILGRQFEMAAGKRIEPYAIESSRVDQ
jgi:hemerythrin superfamily protein